MTDFATFDFTTDVLGQGRYVVNDLDVTSEVAQAAVLIRHGQVPTLQLELRGGGHVSGVGIVQALQDPAGSEVTLHDAVLAWLDTLDPAAIEVLLADGGMGEGLGIGVVRALKALVQ